MANLTGPSGSEDFAGDEFSNNLFSDLAPLLTLFGEQVTKQFLSMSTYFNFILDIYLGLPLAGMGWADNILLAMGPLGIMTIIVSAIRVGRVKMLKAMVGRARESQSDAEQELLSSTSDDVCELWSGHEVVRVMGQPGGMKTLIISDKKVYDLKSALQKHILSYERIEDDDLDRLANAAPNLALNVRNATAGSRELWTWAAVGTILQILAVVIPGVTTYVWQWPKADVKVQGYGYPCFVIGTILVVLGTMVCGHVIEGVTTEHNFTTYEALDTSGLRSQRNYQNRAQVVRLQRACTVSDQHFRSYAIFNDDENHSIRTSRLNTADYSTLAAASSLIAVVGFIVQFVGLRALHWSATIIQLGITIIMTGIRAWARRGLAFDPKTHMNPDGHEIAWLTLHIISNGQYSPQSSPEEMPRMMSNVPARDDEIGSASFQSLQASSKSPHLPPESESKLQDKPFWDIPFDPTVQSAKEMIWEPILGYESFRGNGEQYLSIMLAEMKGNRILSERPSANEIAGEFGVFGGDFYMFQQLFAPLRFDASIGIELTGPPISNEDDGLKLHRQIATIMPADNAVISIASSLASVIEHVMGILCDVRAVKWKHEGIQIVQSASSKDASNLTEIYAQSPDDVYWGFDISTRMPADLEMHVKRLYFRTEAVVNERSIAGNRSVRWQLHDREAIVGVLSLWLYAMAKRRSSIEKFNSSSLIKPGLKIGKIARIVGTASVPDRNNGLDVLSQWLGVSINKIPLPNGFNLFRQDLDMTGNQKSFFLGMFLSPMADADSTTGIPNQSRQYQEVLVVQTKDDSSLEIQFAQELFSLFILAMAGNINEVLGHTAYDSRRHHMATEMGQSAISLENSVFSAIATELVNGGLAQDTGDAYSLIIPAFHKLDLLPRPTM